MKKKLAIIGAGIAGLTLANFIKKNSNYDFMLYEKEESLPIDTGYGIQLSTNTIAILNKIGFNKIDKSQIYHPAGIDFYDCNNKKICDLNLTQFYEEENKYTTLQRSTLIEFLKDEIYTQHLKFGKRIKDFYEIKGKILIKFEDNTNDLVDIVVGADGIFSNTRSFFEKRKNIPKFRNAIALRTIHKSKTEFNIDLEKISLIMGKNCHVVVYPLNKNKELNFVCILRDKDKDPGEIKNLVGKIVKQNPRLEKFLIGDLKSWPLYSTPKILPSTNSKVFYIGDAFNGFLPTLAQGAGQSIESAYELFNLKIENKTDMHNAYFKERSKRARIVRKRSNFNFFIFHFSSSILQTIRNFFMKFLIKRKSFINFYLGKVYKI